MNETHPPVRLRREGEYTPQWLVVINTCISREQLLLVKDLLWVALKKIDQLWVEVSSDPGKSVELRTSEIIVREWFVPLAYGAVRKRRLLATGPCWSWTLGFIGPCIMHLSSVSPMHCRVIVIVTTLALLGSELVITVCQGACTRWVNGGFSPEICLPLVVNMMWCYKWQHLS